MRVWLGALAAACLVVSSEVRADEAPSPYSVPWQLRPVVASSELRLSFARYEDEASRPGTTAVTVFTASLRIDETGRPTAALATLGARRGGA